VSPARDPLRRQACRTGLCLAAAALLAAAPAAGAAEAGPYPSRPVHLVVPAAPGGTVDLLARALAPELASRLGQPVIIENKPGANTHIGTEFTVRAPADGYTLCLSGMTLSTDPWLYRGLPYDPQKDLTPVVLLATSGNVLVVNPGLPARDVEGLIRLARSRPGALHFGTPAIGATGHLAGELFNARAGTQITAVHYKGAAPALTDLIAGSIDMTFDNIPAALQYIRSGRLRALAVTSVRRSAVLPEVPTLDEAGLPGYDLSAWFGLTARAGTQGRIIATLNQAVRSALASGSVRDRMLALGFEPAAGSPEAFAALIDRDRERLGALIRAAGISAQ
jgi:tripartite-type tricarboxylate transporter receptor subunit TctC